jgi:hypothetical protein
MGMRAPITSHGELGTPSQAQKSNSQQQPHIITTLSPA